MARTYKRFGVLVARHEEQREPARARRSSHAMGAAALCSRHRTSPLTVLGKVAAAPIANYLLAVLPPEQEIDRAKKTTLADEVDLEVAETLPNPERAVGARR